MNKMQGAKLLAILRVVRGQDRTFGPGMTKATHIDPVNVLSHGGSPGQKNAKGVML